MKKIIAILTLTTVFMLTAVTTKAQEMSPTGGQTVISTGTKNFTVSPCCAYKTAVFQFVATRVSAAMGGSVLIYGSNDGTNYIQLTEATSPKVTNDTLTVANAATSTGFTAIIPAEGVGFKFYKLAVTGASSDTMTVKCYFSGRQ